ncbi:MAG: hypothetical protein FDZ70_00480 [Actinobacteria bacterium]|nr:MAG: hypothetical protein FDZ70_00480 [Actinomycetota bacterium]
MFAAVLALSENDIKRTLAYSTMSQLGYMMAALGAGGYVAAVFHLITHGFFKSLLFLSAGSVIHGTGTQDIREMGGLRSAMPVTATAMLIGAFGLAGVPPLAGFFSKDEILTTLWRWEALGPVLGKVVFLLALATAILTAFYTFRLYFTVFSGTSRAPATAGAHSHGHVDESTHGGAHESPRVMTVPMMVLAAAVVAAGAVNFPFGKAFLGGLIAPHEHEAPIIGLMLLSVAAVAAGIQMAWVHCRTATCELPHQRPSPGQRVQRASGEFLVRPAMRLSRLLRDVESIVQRMSGQLFVRPAYSVSRSLRRLDVDSWIVYFVSRSAIALGGALQRYVEVDVFYEVLFVRLTSAVSAWMRALDARVIDRTNDVVGAAGSRVAQAVTRFDASRVDAISQSISNATMGLGRRARRLQTGALSNYALFMLLIGIAVFYVARWLSP